MDYLDTGLFPLDKREHNFKSYVTGSFHREVHKFSQAKDFKQKLKIS